MADTPESVIPPTVSFPDGPVPASETAGFALKPQYVNRFQIVVTGDHVRVIFGDAAVGFDATYHSAVVMSLADGQQLGELLGRLIEQHRTAAAPIAKQ